MAIGDGGGQQPQGLSGADLARINQATSSTAKAGDFNGLIDSLLGQSGNFGTFFKTKLDSLFATGIFSQITPSQSIFEKPMNQAAAGMTGRGGRLAEVFAMFKPEFGGIVAPQIAASMQDFSFSSLGNISPMQTPSAGMGMGGMGFA